MNKNALKKIFEHPDKDEIISKLLMDVPTKDIHDWLSSKYTNVSEQKFVIAEKSISSFKENYLDIYNLIVDDLKKTKAAIGSSLEDELELSISNNPTYKEKMIEAAETELDIRKTIKTLAKTIESRLGQIYDTIQADPNNINTRVDRVFLEYCTTLGDILEKYYKFTEMPESNLTVNNNINVQVIDKHISVFHDVIRDILSKIDTESSLYFVEEFNKRIELLREPSEKEITPPHIRLTEAKNLNDEIMKKLDEGTDDKKEE